MKKPITRYALAIWIAASVLAVANSYEAWGSIESNYHARIIPIDRILSFVLVNVYAFGGVIWQVASLFALGALIGVVDQNRWDARNRK